MKVHGAAYPRRSLEDELADPQPVFQRRNRDAWRCAIPTRSTEAVIGSAFEGE
jgi:hypothetical protein